MSSAESTSYNAVAKTLHWLIALAIIFMLALGWFMGELPNGFPKFFAFQFHKSVGITILLLSLCRLGWRLTHEAPPLPPGMAEWERLMARGTHILFYILIIAMPFSGWVMVSASPIPTVLYGLVPWPHLPVIPALANKRAIGHMAGDAHGFMAYTIASLLALHVGAALKHHFMQRDDVLLRMAPAWLHGWLEKLRS
jgi:cytochrome b561